MLQDRQTDSGPEGLRSARTSAALLGGEGRGEFLLRGSETSVSTPSCACRRLKHRSCGFPGGSVSKNPPADSGDVGSMPGLGRSHTPQSN